MNLSGIFSSSWQRKQFLLATGAVTLICTIAVFALAIYAPATAFWATSINLLTSVVASAAFALLSSAYLFYFFVDPTKEAANTTLLAQDIDGALRRIAESASSYFILVRTGRHFRAEILPILTKRAHKQRHPIRIEVILLDCRDTAICKKYAEYRRVSSFDKRPWDAQFVQTEILATILAILETAHTSGGLVEFEIYLSKRLSSFRIEGSPEEILVTREDPKDNASRYSKSHRDFGAYLSDFKWTKEDAFTVRIEAGGEQMTLAAVFGADHPLLALEIAAAKAQQASSPYAR